MRLFAILSLLVLSFFLGLLFQNNVNNTSSYLTPTPTPNYKINKDVLWSLVQDWRVKNNLQPYIKDESVCNIAKIRVSDTSKNWSHDGFDAKFYDMLDCNDWCELSENLTKDVMNEQAALFNWLNSTPHRLALEKNYKYSCIETDGFGIVQIFANF